MHYENSHLLSEATQFQQKKGQKCQSVPENQNLSSAGSPLKLLTHEICLLKSEAKETAVPFHSSQFARQRHLDVLKVGLKTGPFHFLAFEAALQTESCYHLIPYILHEKYLLQASIFIDFRQALC